VFGPSKIPEIARSLGRMMNEVKKASSDISREFRKETTAIERDLKKTANTVASDLKSMTNDPLQTQQAIDHEPESEEIPDVYARAENSETEKEIPQNNEDEKSEKPIQ
jgi:Sec-independent protein translocase protein TatA